MSSNIRLERVCQHCGKAFIAKTTVTQYCGDNCAKRAYKERQRKIKIEASNEHTKVVKLQPITELNAKAFLSIMETCQLLGVSRWTIWRAIKSNELPATKLGKRTIIKRIDLDKLFTSDLQKSALLPTEESPDFSNCYDLTYVKNIYGISEKALYELIKRNCIPKLKRGKYTYVPKEAIDILLAPKFKHN